MEGNYSNDRIPCKICGRSFAPEVLAKHSNICKKTSISANKRKPFDSSKQRVIEGELSLKQIKQAQKKEVRTPKNHWREKHADFLNAVRNARGVQRAIDSGGPLPPPPPPSINPDYIQCPYCSRRFNQQAAERHINFCKEQQTRLPRGKANPAGAAKQNARLNYQVPKPKAKTSPAATPASVPAARPGARPAPTSTRTPVGGAARGRAAPAGEEETETTLQFSEETELTPLGTTIENNVEYETVTALPLSTWLPPLVVGQSPPKKMPLLSLCELPGAVNSSENFEDKELENGWIEHRIRLGTLDLGRGTMYSRHLMSSLRPTHLAYLSRRRWFMRKNVRGADTRGGIVSLKGRQGGPQSHDQQLDYASPHQQNHHGPHELHQDASPGYRQLRNKERRYHHAPEAPADDFFNAPEDFYTPYESPRGSLSTNNGSPLSIGDRSRKADGVPVKSKLNSHYLSKVDASLEDGGMYQDALSYHSPKSKAQANPYCYECGARYPVATAKFCCQCGVKRIEIPVSDSRRYAKGYSKN